MLHQSDTDVLFPPRVIPTLRNLRGPEWRRLIDHLSRLTDESHPDILAFSLMMIRQNSCLTCHAHSFRAMRGCTFCTHQMTRRFKGSDSELVEQWETARHEIGRWLPDARPAEMDAGTPATTGH